MTAALPEDLVARITAMPKVELHVHLEGAQTPETVWAMAERNEVALPARSLEEWRSFYAFRDFAHFIQVYIASSRAMLTAQDFHDMTAAFHEYQARQHILYTEAFLSASLFVDRIPWPDLFAAFREGLATGRARHGVEVRLIPDIARNFPSSKRAVLDFTRAGFEEGVFIGLGLGGLETGYPAEDFTAEFREAREAGMRVVAHAGETEGAHSVRGAIEALGAERIGHGIRCLEDPELVALLRDRQVPLEVCPMSNYRTTVVAADDPHPILAMMALGLNCTVNSDDPPMFSTSLTEEYLYLASQGVPWEQLWALNRNALEVSFLGEEEKAPLRARLDAFEASLPGG